MDFRKSHRFRSVASRIYVEVIFSRKIQKILQNYDKAVAGDVTMHLEVIRINKLWNPMEIFAYHHSYDQFSWISLNIPGIPEKFHFWKRTGK